MNIKDRIQNSTRILENRAQLKFRKLRLNETVGGLYCGITENIGPDYPEYFVVLESDTGSKCAIKITPWVVGVFESQGVQDGDVVSLKYYGLVKPDDNQYGYQKFDVYIDRNE